MPTAQSRYMTVKRPELELAEYQSRDAAKRIGLDKSINL